MSKLKNKIFIFIYIYIYKTFKQNNKFVAIKLQLFILKCLTSLRTFNKKSQDKSSNLSFIVNTKKIYIYIF